MCDAPSDAMVSYLCWSVIINIMSGLDAILEPFLGFLTRFVCFKYPYSFKLLICLYIIIY